MRLHHDILTVLNKDGMKTMAELQEAIGETSRKRTATAVDKCINEGFVERKRPDQIGGMPVYAITTTGIARLKHGYSVNGKTPADNVAASKKREKAEVAISQTMAAAGCARALTSICHSQAEQAGWWKDLQTGEDLRGKRNVGELLCLIHSEISEAMEAHRKGLMDDKLPHRKGLEVELADAAIRIFDMAGGYDLDLAGAIQEKLAFNAQRADHKPENRRLEGGKGF